jgi:hypothetical protein
MTIRTEGFEINRLTIWLWTGNRKTGNRVAD